MSRAREIADLVGGPTPDIILKTADGAILNLQTSDTTVTDGSVLGAINFTAPNEGSGTDALTVGGAILAVAEGTFAADNNATELVFMTGASEAATSKMVLSSGGNLTVTGDVNVGANFDVTGNAVIDGTALVTGVLTTTAATVFNGGFAANDGSTITTADNTTQLTLASTDADGNVGPVLDLYRNSGSPVDNDLNGRILFSGENDNDEKVEYSRISAYVGDASDGTEDGNLYIQRLVAGTQSSVLSFLNTETVVNDGGLDQDFRVESDTKTHMLFVDASTDRVGINESSPDARLHISDSAQSSSFVRIENTASHEGSIEFKTAHSAASNYRLGASISESNNFELFNVDANTGFIKVGPEGAVRMPLQPAFLARPASRQENIPINAITTIVFGTEVFDQNADFASNTFTAPVTGKYQLNVDLLIQQMDKDTDFLAFQLITSNRNYTRYHDNDDMAADAPNGRGLSIIVLTDMDAGDTAYVRVSIPNSGAALMDVEQSSAFSGYLVA
jgi:hypothetical protein